MSGLVGYTLTLVGRWYIFGLEQALWENTMVHDTAGYHAFKNEFQAGDGLLVAETEHNGTEILALFIVCSIDEENQLVCLRPDLHTDHQRYLDRLHLKYDGDKPIWRQVDAAGNILSDKSCEYSLRKTTI